MLAFFINPKVWGSILAAVFISGATTYAVKKYRPKKGQTDEVIADNILSSD